MLMPWRCVMKTEWLRKEIQNFQPYVVAPIHESHVVNANENYMNFFRQPEIMTELMMRLATFEPEKYPKPMADDLRAVLGNYLGVAPASILAGNGGDEMITYVLHTFLNEGDTVLVHQPTFDMYEIGAEILGAKVVKVEDQRGYKRDQAGILDAIGKYQPKLTFLCNPNNPTGELLPASFIEECVKAADNVVLVDEAYMEFAEAESVVPLIGKYQNLIVLRTLSKAFGIAGLRCGYIAADPELIQAVAKVKAPYNLNSLTQLLASIIVEHKDTVLAVRDQIVAERKRLYGELKKIPSVTAYPSRTNFILLQVPEEKQDALFEAWRKADILVKKYTGNPRLPGAFRITVTTADVDDAILKVMKEVL